MLPEQEQAIKAAADGLYPRRFEDDRCIGCQNRAGAGHETDCWLNNLLMLAWDQCGWDNY